MKPKRQKIDDDFKRLTNKQNRKQVEKMLREARKLETIARHHHNSKDPVERAELALQVDQQLEVLKELETSARN